MQSHGPIAHAHAFKFLLNSVYTTFHFGSEVWPQDCSPVLHSRSARCISSDLDTADAVCMALVTYTSMNLINKMKHI